MQFSKWLSIKKGKSRISPGIPAIANNISEIIMHGGIPGGEMPGAHTNWNVPGIKSRLVTHEAPTQSNYDKAIPPWERKGTRGPDEQFGFTDPGEKRMSFKRWLGNKFPDLNTLRRQALQEPRVYT